MLAAAMLVTGALGFAAADDAKGTLVGIDGLSSRTPANWKETTSNRQFRYKEFALPKAEGDKADAELVIYFFETGGGGGVKANIDRWKGQFQPPEGKKIDDVAKLDEFKVASVPVTYLDIQGTYLFKASPMAPQAEPRPNHRMLAAVFESPKGPYYIKLVGPEKTVTQHKKGFDEWLKNFK
jgi:hypothetical protein